MPKRSSKPRDINILASTIVGQATGDIASPVDEGKNPAAVALGRLGGLKGGKARAKLSARKLSAIGRKGAEARWKKKKK